MNAAAAPVKTRLRLSEQRRSEIFDATIDVLLDDGYENTTIEAIAQRAGASKVSLYRHWTGKPTLVLVAARARSGIDLDQISSTSLRSDLAELVRMLSAHGERNIGLVLVLAHAARHDRALAHSIEVVLQPLRSALSALLAAAVERGETTARRAQYAPHLMLGALFAPLLIGGAPTTVTATYLHRYVEDVLLPYLLGQPAFYQE